MKTIASLKTFFAFSLVFVLTIPLSTATTDLTIEKLPPKWEKLGSRKVQFKAEKDVITVTRYEGRFNAVRLKVEKSDINLHRFEIHYGNGDIQRIKVNRVIKAGSVSKNIDLKGRGRRIIKKVEFWYDTKGYEGKKATVELWGRHF